MRGAAPRHRVAAGGSKETGGRRAAVEVHDRAGVAPARVRRGAGDHRRPGVGGEQPASRPLLAAPAHLHGAAGRLHRGVRGPGRAGTAGQGPVLRARRASWSPPTPRAWCCWSAACSSARDCGRPNCSSRASPSGSSTSPSSRCSTGSSTGAGRRRGPRATAAGTRTSCSRSSRRTSGAGLAGVEAELLRLRLRLVHELHRVLSHRRDAVLQAGEARHGHREPALVRDPGACWSRARSTSPAAEAKGGPTLRAGPKRPTAARSRRRGPGIHNHEQQTPRGAAASGRRFAPLTWPADTTETRQRQAPPPLPLARPSPLASAGSGRGR